ncbi:MAG: hypothetical protein ACE5EF_14225 [Dehalococcoidia bacterium]
MARFTPPFCPLATCPSRTDGKPFTWHRKGTYPRKCDGRRIQRFRCTVCGHRFSAQSFRLDYRLHRPALTRPVLDLLVSKTTHRQTARVLGCDRKTVEHRLRLLGRHCRAFHRRMLARCPGLAGTFQFDELETFETDRRLMPVTVPVLIERHSYFVVDLKTAPMGARGCRTEALRRKKAEYERKYGKRRNGSREAVRRTLTTLDRHLAPGAKAHLQTDLKKTYRGLIRGVFGPRYGSHAQESSRRKRNYSNLLFPINHTLAMLRDGVSRLVRRSWGAAKKRVRLEDHLWVWLAWRNYVRPITNEAPRVTPAMALGVAGRKYRRAEMLRWRYADWPN